MTVVAGLHDLECPGPAACTCAEVTLLLAPADPTLGFPKPRMKEPKEPTRLRSRPKLLPPHIRNAVLERDQMLCQWCRVPGGALVMHHRVLRSQGGRDDLQTLVSVHAVCHAQIHEHPDEARRLGFYGPPA